MSSLQLNMHLFEPYIIASLRADTTLTSILSLILLPIAVIALATTIIFSYQKCKRIEFSPATNQRLINAHALATEGCQLLLVILGLSQTAAVVKEAIHMVARGSISTSTAACSLAAFVPLSFAYHRTAIEAVDMVEGWMVLGGTAQPYHRRPFVLTRNCLVSLLRKFRAGRRERCTKSTRRDSIAGFETLESALKDAIVIRAAIRRRLARLQYLDLAGVERSQWTGSSHGIDTISMEVMAERVVSGQRDEKYQETELPTPPDSDQSKESKRVKWADSITVFSPSGAERRFSSP